MANTCKQIPFCEIYEKDPECAGERCISHLCDAAPAYSTKWGCKQVRKQQIEEDQVFRKISWIDKVNKEVTDLVVLIAEKQEAYGDSFGQSGKIIEVLYPEGIQPNQYKDALTIIRIIDKLFRIANKKDAFGETPWRDITGYALLSLVRDIETSKSENLDIEEYMRDNYRV